MLNFFPLPNWTDPDPWLLYDRNYRQQCFRTYPKRQDLIRIDYNLSDSLQVYYRFVKDKDEQTVPFGMWVNEDVNYSATPIVFGQPGKVTTST